MVDVMAKVRKLPGLAEAERIQTTKDIWAAAVEQVWTIGTVGLSPAVASVRVSKINLGNVPERTVSGVHVRNPLLTQPATFYWKS
jgi:hypothetical protein